MNDNNILEFRDITKHFPNFTLDHLTFHLPRGYIMGLIGANGAGKTTAVRLILNMLDPDGGEIRVFGLDSRRQEKEIKEQTGAVFDSSFFPDTWTVDDTERAISPFYREWNPQTFRQMIRRFRLPARTKIGELSRGMQMKLMLACALSHNARLLILDEPTSGLDPATRDEFLDILQEYISDGEKSVLFSTHITADLERIADYITCLDRGKLIYTGSMEGLLQKYYLIKGRPDELTPELQARLYGLRQTPVGFEGLIEARAAAHYNGYLLDPPTIDDIIIHISRR